MFQVELLVRVMLILSLLGYKDSTKGTESNCEQINQMLWLSYSYLALATYACRLQQSLPLFLHTAGNVFLTKQIKFSIVYHNWLTANNNNNNNT